MGKESGPEKSILKDIKIYANALAHRAAVILTTEIPVYFQAIRAPEAWLLDKDGNLATFSNENREKVPVCGKLIEGDNPCILTDKGFMVWPNPLNGDRIEVIKRK